MFYIYILQSQSTGRFYIGSTDNLQRRVAQHNDPDYRGSKTTKRFTGPWVIVHSESFATRSEAVRRERQIKSWKNKKAIAALIECSDG
ncbi:MAG: GIY-YIG nuclease family protein [Deltaproteobacteria bacterium]|nr:GIY-YIG nuclease family protein [Deltaproteobacteria bacterium]